LLTTAQALQATVGIQNFYGVGATPDATKQVPLLVDPSNFLYAPRLADLAGLVSKLKQSICTNSAVATTQSGDPTTGETYQLSLQLPTLPTYIVIVNQISLLSLHSTCDHNT